MIPAEAVEAAARVMAPAVWGPQVWAFAAHGETPTEARDRVQKQVLRDARAALEAAAPHMLEQAKAEAWDEGHDAAADEMAKYENPYRPTP